MLWLLPGLFFYVLFRLCTIRPDLAETVYSRTLFPVINKALSVLTGVLPFSLGEMLLYASVLSAIAYIAWTVVQSLRARRAWWQVVFRRILALLGAASMIYALFVGLWGLNYARLPLGETLGLNTLPATVEELYATCGALIESANTLKYETDEESSEAFTREDVMRAVSSYYDRAAQKLGLSCLGGYSASVKPVAFSTGLCYTRIEGIYWPFTGEANVNMKAPMLLFPATCLHEAAHQRGFAREDEANFLAYYASTCADNAYVRYSGTMLALIHAMNALYGANSDQYYQLWDTLSPGIRADLDQANRFWEQYESPAAEIATEVNNGYLRANRQTEGVKSYGRMVDLLIGLWRQDGI